MNPTAAPRRGRARRGAAAVEFALIAQLFFFLCLTTFDIVGMMNAYSTLQWANQTAAQTLLSDPTRTSAQVAISAQNAAHRAGFTTANGTAFVTTQAACGTLQCMTITASFTYRFVTSAAFCAGSGGALCQVNLVDTLVVPIVPNT